MRIIALYDRATNRLIGFIHAVTVRSYMATKDHINSVMCYSCFEDERGMPTGAVWNDTIRWQEVSR